MVGTAINLYSVRVEFDVDVGACATAGREADADWFIYEHDGPEDPVSPIQAGSAFLDDLQGDCVPSPLSR